MGLLCFLDVLLELVQDFSDRLDVLEVALPAVVLLEVFVDVVLVARRKENIFFLFKIVLFFKLNCDNEMWIAKY